MRRMRLLGLRNFAYVFPLTAFLIVLMCFLRYHNPGPIKMGEMKNASEKQELIQVLRNATMPDRTIVLTMVDESHARPGSLLEVLLQSFKSGQDTQRFLNHLVIIAMDPQAYEYCRLLHPHCIHPSTFEPYFSTRRLSITTPDHSVFSWRRNNVLIDVIELGYHVIFTDTDVLWLRSPLENFDPTYELSISCNFSSAEEGGIFFLKANEEALEFLKHWKLSKFLYTSSNVEESLCATMSQNQEIAVSYDFYVNQIDTNHFGGFCQINNDMFETAYTIHANCCGDLRSKVHDMKIVLEDWISFRNGVQKENATEKVALRWPQKCIG